MYRGGTLGFNANSYSQIKGADDRIMAAVVGVNSHRMSHIAPSQIVTTFIGNICNVHSRASETAAKIAEETNKERPKTQLDFRKLIEEKSLDIVTIATPQNGHAPMSIMAVKAGNNFYFEKSG